MHSTKPNLLPYFFAFFILFIIALVALTWMLDKWNLAYQCHIDPGIWCYDDWTCNKSCSGFDPCFQAVGATGLASCLYGTTSAAANYCKPNPGDSISCTCPASMQNANNCFSNCAGTLGDVKSGAVCCCKPGAPGCQWTNDTLPAVCGKNT